MLDAPQRVQEFLTFRLGAEEYGIDILKVQEIRSIDEITRLANLPDFIKGVIDLRGIIVPIVDMRLKFHLTDSRYTDFTVAIILNIGSRVVGIIVDAVSDVVSLAPEAIKIVPEFGSAIDTRYIMGIAKLDSRMLVLADIDRLMTSDDMQLIDSARR